MAQSKKTGSINIEDINLLPGKSRSALVEKVAKIERKTFPASEAFDFNLELKKKNATMLLAFREEDGNKDVVGYLVYHRMKRLALLHKICVIESERGKSIGNSLMHCFHLSLQKSGCASIQLWVDDARIRARQLYDSCGYAVVGKCVDYYGPGRTGLKMELAIPL